MPAIALAIPSMTCANCHRHVREALAGVPGVALRDLDAGKRIIRIEVADDAALARAEAALDEEGYTAQRIASC